MSIFCEKTPQCLQKNFKLLKYEHIMYHFKAHDLEIPYKYKYKLFREICKFRGNIMCFEAIYNMFIVLKFEFFSETNVESFRAQLLMKSRNQKKF